MYCQYKRRNFLEKPEKSLLEDHQPAIDSLTARFERAEQAIALILSGVAVGATAGQLRAAQVVVARELSALMSDVVKWIGANVPRMYRRAAEDAARSMVLRLPAGVFEERLRQPVHTESLQSLAEDLLSDMARATEEMSKDAKKRLREIGRRQLRKAMERTNPIARVPDFRAETAEHEIVFTDRSGRKWKASKYARLCLLTQSGVLLNTASVNTGLQFGSPGVRVSDGDYDEVCRRARGQVWSLNFALRNPLHHPFCKRSFAPLSPAWRGKLDRVLPGERELVA